MIFVYHLGIFIWQIYIQIWNKNDKLLARGFHGLF